MFSAKIMFSPAVYIEKSRAFPEPSPDSTPAQLESAFPMNARSVMRASAPSLALKLAKNFCPPLPSHASLKLKTMFSSLYFESPT